MNRPAKWILAICAAAALLVPLLWVVMRPAGIPWRDDYAAALAEARSTRRPVVAYLYTDWCTYCRKMDAETFPSQPVKDEAGRYVWVKLNAEKDGDGVRLRKEFAVQGYPTMLILDPEGTRIDQIEGFLPPAQFVQTLRQSTTGETSLLTIRARADANPASSKARYQLAEKYLELQEYRKAAEVFSRIISTDPSNRDGQTELAYYNLALSLASLNEPGKAEHELDLLAERFPAGKITPEAMILRGQIYYRQGEWTKSRQLLETFLEKYPQHPRAGLVRRMVGELTQELPLQSSH